MRNTPYNSSNVNGTPTNQSFSANVSKPKSMAAVRGQDWGLMGTGVGAVNASRPVLVQCYPDRLVVVAEPGERSRVIPMAGRTQDSVDDLISAVWAHVKTWGKAGRGLYWKPTLGLDVQPGGQQRFDDVKALLADSGLDVEQRKTSGAATAAGSPPRATRTPATTR
jgi:hypothetical protein